MPAAQPIQRWLLCLLCSFAPVWLHAQPVFYFIEVGGNPSPYLNDFVSGTQVFIGVNMVDPQPLQAEMRFTLYNERDELIGRSLPVASMRVLLEPTTVQLEGIRLFDPGQFTFLPPHANRILRSGRLPEGQYRICLEMVEVQSGEPLNEIACGFFGIAGVDPPLLLYPPEQVWMTEDELMNTIFQWTPVLSPHFFTNACYRFVLWEVYEGQVPREAMQVNTPLVEQTTFQETSFWWPENLMGLLDSHYYVWSVQMVDCQFPEPITDFGDPHVIKVVTGPTTKGSGGTTTEKPPSTRVDTTRQNMAWGVPDPMAHGVPDPTVPPETRIDKCNDPTYTPLPDNPISAGMVVEQKELFPYPRAVPIRGEAYDWDLVEWKCTGCDDPRIGKEYRAVPDQIVGTDFQWKLEGPGSLESSFKADQIDSLNNQMDSMRARMDEIRDSLPLIDTLLESVIPDKKARTESQIAKLEEDLARIDSLIDELNRQIDSLTNAFDHHTERIGELQRQIDSASEAISRHQGTIDSLQGLLDGRPGVAELAQRDVLGDLQDNLEQLRQDIEALRQEITDTERSLRDGMATALDAVRQAEAAYKQQVEQVEQWNKQIQELQSTSIVDPRGFTFLSKRRDWIHQSYNFIETYGQSMDSALYAQQWTISMQSYSTVTVEAPNLRQQRFNTFNQQRIQFAATIEGLCLTAPGFNRAECSDAARVTNETAQLMADALEDLVPTDYLIGQVDQPAIDSIRALINQARPGMANAEADVRQAVQDYQAAVDRFTQDINALQQQLQALQEQEQALLDNIAQAAALLRQLEQQRIDETERNREAYLTLQHEKGLVIDQLELDILQALDSIASHAMDTLRLGIAREELQRQLESAEREKGLIEESLGRLRDKLTQLDQEAENLRERKPELEKELEDLEEALEDLEEDLEELMAPQKTAVGELIYYIPPPLENILQHPDKFDSLKREVTKAELELDEAYAFKAAVQNKQLRELEKLTRNLQRYAEAKKSSEELEEKIKEAQDDLDKLKTKKAQEHHDRFEDLEDREEGTGEAIDKLKQRIEKLEADSARLKERFNRLKDELIDQDSLIASLKRDLDTAVAQLAWEEDQLRRVRNTLSEASAALEEARQRLKELEADLDRALNDLTTATATDNPAQLAAARNRRQQAEAALKGHRENVIPSREAAVSSASASTDAATQRTEAARALVDQVTTAWNEAKRIRQHELNDSLVAASDSLLAVLNELKVARKRLHKQEQDFEQVRDARHAMQDSVAQDINKDEDVKAKADDLKKMQADKEAADKAMQGLLADMQANARKKDELAKEADDRLKEAKDNLEKAKDDLRQYLLKEEFEVVDFQATLTLDVTNNYPLDGFRVSDAKTTVVVPIIYPKDREFKFEDVRAVSDMPSRDPEPAACMPVPGYIPESPPPKGGISAEDIKGEPRTIALVYKKGEPLWPEWPVIPDSVGKILAKDVIRVRSSYGTDKDKAVVPCLAHEDCPPGQIEPDILDLATYTYIPTDGAVVSHFPMHQRFWWEVPLVKKPKPDDDIEINAIAMSNFLADDGPVRDRGEPKIYPGVMIETTEELVGIPDTQMEVQTRVVTGDHKGLPGEDIEWEVKLVAGHSEGWGFNGTDTFLKETTAGGGYCKVMFDFGDGFAEFEMTVKWKRGEKVMDERTLQPIAPVKLQMLRFTRAPNEVAWQEAMKLFAAGNVSKSQADGAADAINDDDGSGNGDAHGIAGLQDVENNRVNERRVDFSLSGDGPELTPETDTTRIIGIARTLVTDLPDETEVTLTAEVDSLFEPVGKPPRDQLPYNTTKIQEFRIGSEESMWLVKLEDEVSEGEIIDGTGTLEVDVSGLPGADLIKDIMGQEVRIHDVELEQQGEGYVAIAGSISLVPSPAISATVRSFSIGLDSFLVPAGVGAGIGGHLGHEALEVQVKFYAELDNQGNFYGTVEGMPAITIKDFKIREGTSFTLDMHGYKSPPGFAQEDFKGVVIHSATIEMPKTFASAEATENPTLTAKDLYIGTSGFGGAISYNGLLFKMGFGGFALGVDSLAIEFRDNSLVSCGVAGTLQLPSPMEGRIRTAIGYTGEEWRATLRTEDPVMIPRLKTTFNLMTGTGITYNMQEELATLRLNAFAVSDYFDSLEIKGFMVNSRGEIAAEAIHIGKAITFGKGFSLHVQTVSFAIMDDDYGMTLDGGFSFPRIGIDNLEGTVTLAPGPSVGIAFRQVEISFDYKPVTFVGKFSYTGREFKGEFDIGIEKIISSGISGLVIVGNTEDADEVTFSYWYAQLSAGVRIPLGQSGFSILELGGGLGYNYVPPIGSQEGSPAHNQSFAFKAMIGAGTTPGGEVVAGRMEMVLQPGKFSLGGKVWLLMQEKNMFGEGVLNLQWDPEGQVDGFVRMFVGIPDADGGIFQFEGKVNFLFSSSDTYVRSETITGSFMQAIQAEGRISISKDSTVVAGRMYYSLNKEFPLLVVTAIVKLDVEAGGHFRYMNASKNLNAEAYFNGLWDVDLDTPIGTYDIVSGSLNLKLELTATPVYVEGKGSAHFSYDIWVWSDTVELDVGFRYNL